MSEEECPICGIETSEEHDMYCAELTALRISNKSLRKSLEDKDLQLLEAEAQNAELREVVKSLEWAASVWEDACDDCPEEENGGMCMECFAHHHAGHEKDCKLNKVLSKTTDPTKLLEAHERVIEAKALRLAARTFESCKYSHCRKHRVHLREKAARKGKEGG